MDATPTPIPLDEEVRALLERRKGEWRRIAAVTENAEPGRKVSYSWITKFAARQIPNPGFAKLQNLRAVLLEQERRAQQEAA